MTITKAILLGILQGITEFLPISSSGHLALAQYLLGVKETPLLFDVALHVGTLIAIFAAFWSEIKTIILGLFGKETSISNDALLSSKRDVRMLTLYIVVATIPTVLIALLIEKYVENAFKSPLIVSIMLMITGTMLWLSGKVRVTKGSDQRLNLKRALIIGAVQGISAMPGISRSGSTISTGLISGLNGRDSARFSLLLSVPAIIGAMLYELKDVSGLNIGIKALLIGTISSFIVGYFAIRFLLKSLQRGYFPIFAYYCWLIGLLGLISYIIL